MQLYTSHVLADTHVLADRLEVSEQIYTQISDW